MNRLLAGLGNVVLFIVLAPLMLGAMILLLPYAAAVWVVAEVLVRVRREPSLHLPQTGVVLVGRPDAETSREIVAAAIHSRCSAEVARHVGEDGDVTLTSDAAAELPVVVRQAEEPVDEEDEIEVDIGPWTVGCPEGYDYGEGDAAVAMAMAYLDRGLTTRVIGQRTVALLRLEESGVWWRPEADGGGSFAQAGFRDLPGRAATDAERARHLTRTRARQDEH
ncbi:MULTISPECIES: hypothetical protein [Brachybacterium]|uniref:hypothetical protein n=1 Tax=Brachybacterium TaxID=43668 RepID=UPI0006B63FD8|nr:MULTISPECIES: hypothetical protein [Brachybacterium]